jgi:hypothetical protein
VKFEVLTVVKKLMMFWVVMPCELIDRYQHFREKYPLHLQGWPQDEDSMIVQNASTVSI